MKGGIFITPKMRSIADKTDRICQAAAARSPGSFFPCYTEYEIAEIHRLDQEYREEDEATNGK